MTYREVERKLRHLGCQEIRRRSGGSHRKWINPLTGRASTVPDWGVKDLKLGTIRGIVRQLGLDWQTFEEA
jgi:mRNA interferase HicA